MRLQSSIPGDRALGVIGYPFGLTLAVERVSAAAVLVCSIRE